MREIKFRVWNEFTKKYETLQEVASRGAIMPRGNELKTTVNYPLILEQYTGLKDKNGVEIYEGDVVKVFDINIVGCIVYDSSRASFFIEIDEDEAEILWYYPESFEIIGNSHEEEK